MSIAPPRTHAAALAALDWSWTPAGRARPAVDGVTLQIEPGERVLLLGASGSGKSTLLQGWAGVLGGADEGVVGGALRVDGAAPDERRGRVGLLLQDPDAQLVHARARDDVGFGPENLAVPPARIADRVDAALVAVGLALPAEAEGARLSGGQRQRLAMAGLLALEPAALLLDEPTAQLDPVGAAQVVEAVAALVRDRARTLVVVEHRVDLWLPHVDRIVVLDRGRVVADGPAADVLAQRGPELARLGVWGAGREAEHPPAPRPPITADAPVLLAADGLDGRPAGGQPLGHALDLQVRAGEVVALTGPNGAGKSTLLLTLAGLLPAAAGTVSALDQGDPAGWSSRELAARLGVVFQNPEHQFVAATVRVELAAGVGGLDGDAARVDALLERLGLRGHAAVSPYALSGGEQRRLSVATALAAAPPLLLLDEPTFGQDSRTWAALAALLAEHRDAGGAVVMATHDRALIAALGAREVALPAPARPTAPPATAPRPTVPPVTVPPPTAPPATVPPATVPPATVPPATVRQPPLAEQLNPVAAIAASLLPALLLVTTIDVTSAAVALALQLLLIPALGVPLRPLLRRAAPVLIAAPFAALTIALYGRESGRVYAEFLLVRISDGSLELALATLLRILAIALPAIALFTRPDATRLGDALGQNLRLPSRFVLGSVAALRLLTVLGDDARTLERARRARGLGDRSRLRRLGGQVFGLLVLAIRRGSALAIGMEARGFGAPGPRTWWRPSPWRASDTLVVVIAVGVAVIAVAAAIITGSFTNALG